MLRQALRGGGQMSGEVPNEGRHTFTIVMIMIISNIIISNLNSFDSENVAAITGNNNIHLKQCLFQKINVILVSSDSSMSMMKIFLLRTLIDF